MNTIIKTCVKCGQDKPITEYYLRSDRQTRRHNCKTCYNARTRSKRHTDAWARIEIAKMLGVSRHQPHTQRVLIVQKIAELTGKYTGKININED